MELSRDLSPRFKALLEPLRKHVTPYRFCWLLAALSFLIAWNRGIALLYAIVALTLAALFMSHLLAWSNLRGVRVVRERIPPPAPGDTPLLRYRLRAPGRRHFLLIDEPALTPVAETLVTQFDRSAVVERELDGLHRGVYRLGPLRVATAYPFGLLARQHDVAQAPQEIVVYPRLHEVRRLPAPGTQAQSANAEVVAQRRRGWEEFAGVREQRPGESLKHIHWRASARQNQLMVKEYETLDMPGMWIVLPQQPGFERGTAPHSCFEYAMEIAASLVRAACRAGHPVHCVSYGKHERQLHVAAHTVELSPMLEWFAYARPDGTTRLADAVERALRKVPKPGWLVTFRHDSETVHRLAGAAQHLDFIFEAQSFRDREDQSAEASADPVRSGSRYHVTRHCSLPALLT